MLETDILVVIRLYYLQLVSCLQVLHKDSVIMILFPWEWIFLEGKEFGLLFNWLHNKRFLSFSVVSSLFLMQVNACNFEKMSIYLN